MNGPELDFSIPRLGECRFPSPMRGLRFAREDERVLHATNPEDLARGMAGGQPPPAMETAGPREKIFFDPARLACGIVTCGGLCPGLNDVIRSIVLSLYHHYGVQTGLRFPLRLRGPRAARIGHKPMRTDPRLRSTGSTRSAGRSSAPRAAPRTRPRWSRPSATSRSASSSPSAATARCAARRRSPRRPARRGLADQRHRHPEDDRQRRLVRAEDLRVRDGGRRGAARHLRGQHRGRGGAQRHRPGEAHGARLRVHRRLFGPGRQPGEFLPRSRRCRSRLERFSCAALQSGWSSAGTR